MDPARAPGGTLTDFLDLAIRLDQHVPMEVNIHEAKTHLSRLIERALAGEEVIIARAGKPLVRLESIESPRPVLGSARGSIEFREGWDGPLTDQEFEDLFGR